MGTTLGNIGKARKIDRVHRVIHVGFENVIVPVFSRWTILHVALIVIEPSRGGERSVEVSYPFVEIRVDHNVRRREDNMFRAPGMGGGSRRMYQFSFLPPLQLPGTIARYVAAVTRSSKMLVSPSLPR